jgi:hypothetical protein
MSWFPLKIFDFFRKKRKRRHKKGNQGKKEKKIKKKRIKKADEIKDRQKTSFNNKKIENFFKCAVSEEKRFELLRVLPAQLATETASP